MNKKGWKIRTLIGSSLVLMLPCLAIAIPPNTNMAVGEVEGIVHFCVKADPHLAKDAESMLKGLAGQVPQGARATAEYKDGYNQVTAALEKVNQAQVRAACTQGLTQPKHRDRDDGHGRR